MRLPALLFSACTTVVFAAPVDFVREVRPIFEKHCYECHGAEKQKNGFRVDVKQEAFHSGDEHAPNIVAGKSAESPLFRFVSGADEKLRMPPKSKGEALSTAEIATLKQWLDEGAVWPDRADKVTLVDRTDWWSFKPLERSDGFQPSTPPHMRAGSRHYSNQVDAFILARLAEKGLTSAPEADPRTLIRRLSYDLTGLPPTPEEADAFVSDTSNRAYEKLVDRLLASPRYGERWARHWLDVVHYGETHGYDKDKPRNNAWPYRDYVIRALNEDKPYARFVQEQLAGDVLFPGTVDGIVALGFIAAGPWDLIGHMEVPESKIDGMIARHLDRDDMVQNTMGTFCSLTAGCAQCHNHKFDPITQEDYYSLQAVFAAVDRTDKKYFADPKRTARFNELDVRRTTLLAKKQSLDAKIKQLAGSTLTEIDGRIEALAKQGKGNTRAEFGYHSAISRDQGAEKWVQLDMGRSVVLDRVVLRPCYDDFNKIGAGFGFPVRYRVEACDDAEFKANPVTLAAKSKEDVANPGTAPITIEANGTTARYLRVTALKLAPRMNDFIFALAELQAFDTAGHNVAEGALVAALDSIEAPPRWRKGNLVDTVSPVADESGALAKLRAEREALMRRTGDDAMRTEFAGVKHSLAEVDAQLAGFPKPDVVYAGTVHHGTGAFAGTSGKPRVIKVLKRGDVKTPAEEVNAGGIAALSAMHRLPAHFEVADPMNEGASRAALAQWITARDNPLVWRSIVNRVWQHHFGRPLVDTPNDFGRMGAQPSHPEMLDWLAVTFRDDFGGSFKTLHKLIVMSHTYRQSSGEKGAARRERTDAENRFVSHQNRRKLDAESIRDSVLSIAGKLDLTMGGPSFQDFVIEKPEHSPHYEYSLHDPEDPKSHRRSIYRFIVRSQQQPFMTCLDCADPSMRVDKRNESLSPLQALAMMNNGLMVAMGERFAKRVERECPGDVAAQVERAFELALSRKPTGEESTVLVAHVQKHGLANACRLMMNLNEFAFAD